MADALDQIIADRAAAKDQAARAAQPGSTLPPPPDAPQGQNPEDVLPGLPATDAAPAPPQAIPAPAQPGGVVFESAPSQDQGAPPAQPDVLDQIVQSRLTQSNGRLTAALDVARKLDPDRYTEASRIASRDGLPLDFVTANLDDLKSQATANDMRKVLEGTPTLKNWFLSGDNANTVKLDDLHKLSGLNWLYQATAENWNEGWAQRQSSDIRYRQIFGNASDEEVKAADKADKADKRDYGVEGFFQGAIPALAQQLPNMIGGLYEGVKKAPYAATLGTAAGAAVGSAFPGLGTAAGAASGFASGVSAGMIQGRALDSFRQEAGGAYGEFLQIRGDSGERIDPAVAKGAALIAGVANSALETIGEAALERLVPGLDKFGVGALLRNGSRDMLKEAIKRPTIQAALRSFGGNVLRGGATEVGTEVAQEAITIMARIAAEKNSAGEFQQMEPAEIATRLADTAEQTAQAMLVLTPALASPRFGRDLSNARRSEQARSMYEGANEAAKTTELRERAPEKYLDAVKSFLQDGKASDTVYVPSDKMTEMFQSMELTPQDLDARIDGFSQRYAEAVATGGDVNIPMEEYQTHIAGTPLGDALIEHQRWQPEMMTVSEARDALAEAKQKQDEILEQALVASREDAARAAPRQKVEAAVYDMLVNIGESPDTARAQAQVQAAFFDTMGQRAGVDPVELFQRQNLDVRRAMPDGLDYRKTDELDIALDAVRRGDGDRAARLIQRGQGPSLGAFLAKEGGLDESDAFAGELRSRDLKRRNGGKLLAKPGKGIDLDTASLRAAEAGYFPNAVNEDGTVNREGLVEALLSALDEEGAGRNLYTVHADDVKIDPQLRRVAALKDELSALGLDTASMTNEEIRAELQKATSFNAIDNALFQEPAATGDKRGSIQFMDGRTVINLFQQANLSTFLHESGHLFLEVSKQVAEAADAPDAIKKDWRTVLDFIGAKEGAPIEREAHERFAKAFETYLSEGRAPSDELRGVFERFKSWLMYVYRGAARIMGLPAIPANIRDVFDRMLATDQEIAEVQRDPAVRPMFKDAADAGVTDAQWARMQRAAEAATDAAKGHMLAEMIAERTRETTKQWREQKEAIRQEVFDEYSNVPTYQAQHYIATGEVLNSDGVVPMGVEERRLDRKWLVRRYGKDVLKRIPKVSGRLQYVEKGGLNPDEVAEWFGFNSGEHLVNELMSAVPFARAVIQRTDELMRERNGDLLTDQRAAAEAATKAFHNDLRTPVLELELQALAAKAKLKGPAAKVMDRTAAREMARDLIRSKKVAEATRVAVFARARDRSARNAEAAMLAGDFARAVDFKRQQIMNHALTLEAQAARDDAESVRRYLDRFSDRKRPAGVDPDYLDQIEAILERFEFKRSTSLPAIERRKSLAQFVAEATERGDAILVPPDLLDKAQLVSYKDMTMEDLSAMRDVVKNIEHLGRLKNRLLEKGRLKAFAAARDELVQQAEKTPPKKKQKYRNPTSLERFGSAVAGVDAYLLKMEQVFQWLDMGDVNGPFTRIIFQKFVDAQNRKGELQAQVATRLKTILDGLDKGYLDERKSVPIRPELTFTRSELYAIALNQGTESNRQKILKGEVSATNSFRDEAEMNSALSLLTKEDWDRVQAMWDVLESFWPETAALERRITGVEPPKLERRKVVTEHGEYAGGYYPMVYDPAQSFDVQMRADEAADKLFDNSTFSRPTVEHGFTKKRVDNYSRPVLLDLRALTGHIDKAIQNITHREAVRDAYKLIADPQLQAAVIERMGRPVYGEMVKWLDRIAKDRGDPSSAPAVQRALSAARANVSLYAMGFRLTTALSQLAGFSNSTELVRPSYLGSALASFLRHPFDTWDVIAGKSGEMRDRTNNMERDIRTALQRLEGKTGVVDVVKRHAFWLTAMADRTVCAPTWLGAYNQHLATYPTDEAGAVRAGDRAVRLTQGSGAAKDLSGIMGDKNGPAQILTLFYSYFNLFYNRLRTLGRDSRIMLQDGDYEDIPHLVARSISLVILPAIMADVLVGKWKDEDEGWAWWAFRKASLYPLMSVPVARDIAGAMDSGLGYQFSPLGRIGELAVKSVMDANKFVHGEDVDGRLAAKRAAELAGYTFGLPLGQGVSTASNVWQGLAEGNLKLPKDILLSRRAFGDTRDK
jgi:hypothetical protein